MTGMETKTFSALLLGDTGLSQDELRENFGRINGLCFRIDSLGNVSVFHGDLNPRTAFYFYSRKEYNLSPDDIKSLKKFLNEEFPDV